MDKKIVILTIPGIGTKQTGYSNDFEKDIRRFTKNEVSKNLRFIESRPFSVTDVDQNQDALFRRLESQNKLGGI